MTLCVHNNVLNNYNSNGIVFLNSNNDMVYLKKGKFIMGRIQLTKLTCACLLPDPAQCVLAGQNNDVKS
jgi:hypothetical protein